MALEKDYYRILGVDVDACERDIEQAYRRAARAYYRDHTHRLDEDSAADPTKSGYPISLSVNGSTARSL